jgi:hypothetical protein
MRRALLSDAFQTAIPSFPKSLGYEVVNFFQSCRHPRDAIVLCQRGPDYVVWTANMIEGGCHNGSYHSDEESSGVDGFADAWKEFESRIARLS